MSASSEPGSGSPLRVARLVGLLPPLSELAPFLDLLISSSRPDPERLWTGSGELGTVGDRIVDTALASRGSSRLARSEARRLADLYRRVAILVEALERGDGDEVVELLLEQGKADEEAGRGCEAEAWYLSAHRLAKDLRSLRAPRALRLAARAARHLGRLEEAGERYERAWRDAEDLGLEDDMLVAAIGRGNVAVDQGRWEEARRWYGRVAARLEEGGEPRAERWQLFQNLAIVHRESGQLADARRFLDRARREGELLDDANARVEVGNGWGQLLLAEGDARGAELHFVGALASARGPRARVAIGVNLGEALLKQGRVLEAGERARQAEADALAGGVTGRLPEIYRLLAAVSRARGEPEAFVFLEQALDLIRDRGLPPFEEALTREAYGDLRLAEGDPVRGLPELEAAAAIYQSLGMERAGDRLRARIEEERGGPVTGDPSGANRPESPRREEEGGDR